MVDEAYLDGIIFGLQTLILRFNVQGSCRDPWKLPTGFAKFHHLFTTPYGKTRVAGQSFTPSAGIVFLPQKSAKTHLWWWSLQGVHTTSEEREKKIWWHAIVVGVPSMFLFSTKHPATFFDSNSCYFHRGSGMPSESSKNQPGSQVHCNWGW